MNAVASKTPPSAEVDILDNLVKHARKLALTEDAQKRIEASRWQIFFEAKLREVKAEETKQLELVNMLADPDDEAGGHAVNFSKHDPAELQPKGPSK